MSQQSLQQTIQWTPPRPVSSEVVGEIVELVNNPATSIARLAATLSKDQMLVRSVLKKANSSYYGYPQQVNNVNVAVVLLGFDVLKETVVRVLVDNTFRNVVDTLYKYEEFWNHSIGCGITSRVLAEKLTNCNPEDAFVAGLLHDIGFLMGERKKEERGERTGQRNNTYFDHAKAGAAIVEQWHISPEIVEAIRCHHTPWQAQANPVLTATVHVADILCQQLGIGKFDAEPPASIDRRALDALNISAEKLSEGNLVEYARHIHKDMAEAPKFHALVGEIKSKLIRDVEQLSEREKLVLALRYHEALSFSEIATMLTATETEARQLHEQALSKLRSALQQYILV